MPRPRRPCPTSPGCRPTPAPAGYRGSPDALRALDCASGKALWQAPPPPDASTLHLVGFVAPHGIYELAAGHARLRDERTGKLVWDVALPGALAWPRGAEQPVPPDLSGAKRIALLDPATGQETASVPLPADATVLPDCGGAFFVVRA